MRNYQAKNNFRQFLESKPALIGLSLILLLFVWGLIGSFGKLLETIKNKNLAQEKVSELTDQENKLNSSIGELNTTAGVEGDIRNKFGLAKPGEGVIVVVDGSNDTQPTNAPASQGFLNFWKNIFK